MASVDHLNAAPPAANGYLTVRETAQVLKMHYMSVYKMVQQGRLPAIKIGSRWKIDPEELRQWAARHQQTGRCWLLAGGRESSVAALRALLGPQHMVRGVPFGALRAALDDEHDVLLLDTTLDPQAALAALALCREVTGAALTILLIGPPAADVLHEALRDGVVTALALPFTAAQVEQVSALLHSP
jgi:excisionase family DNA binding protein